MLSCQQGKKATQIQTLKIKGSESMHETFTALKKDFEAVQDSVRINLEGGGSRTGLAGIQDGSIDIGLSSYAFNIDSILGEAHQVQEKVVAYDGIVLISNENNPIKKLTDSQIAGIYNGEYTDWSQLGGNSGPIKAIVRNMNSGTQKFFTAYFGLKDKLKPSKVADDNDEIFAEVVRNQNSIGFVGFAYFKVGVNDIMLPSSPEDSNDFYHPTVDNLGRGLYPLKRGLRIYYSENPSPALDAFLVYLNSERAQSIIEESGVVPSLYGQTILNASID